MAGSSGGFKICIESKEKAWKTRGGGVKERSVTPQIQSSCVFTEKGTALLRRYVSKRTSFLHRFLLETGSAVTSTCIGLGNSLTPPAGQAGKPVPGYNGKRQTDTNQPTGSFYFLKNIYISLYSNWGKNVSFRIAQWGKTKRKAVNSVSSEEDLILLLFKSAQGW